MQRTLQGMDIQYSRAIFNNFIKLSQFPIFQGFLRATYAAELSFDAKIVDPLIGGTYITLLNTCRFVEKSKSEIILIFSNQQLR